MGNYKSFGDTKFIPTLAPDKFEGLCLASAAPTEAVGLGRLYTPGIASDYTAGVQPGIITTLDAHAGTPDVDAEAER